MKKESKSSTDILNEITEPQRPFAERGQVVFFLKTEETWNRPYTKKRHHFYDTRTVILRGIVKEINGDEFSARLEGNNGFELDGETYVFHRNNLLCDQEYADKMALGKWRYCDNSGYEK